MESDRGRPSVCPSVRHHPLAAVEGRWAETGAALATMEREPERGAMAETASSSATITETVDSSQPAPTENRSITIRLRKRKTNKKVEWSSDTVDNEHLGRRSSKCCCIYEKPRAFGESSSESEEENGGCGNAHCLRGHKKPFPGAASAGPAGGGASSKPVGPADKPHPPEPAHSPKHPTLRHPHLPHK